MSEGSAFKQLYSQMINSGGNVASVQNSFKDSAGKIKKIKCFVKEAFPHFLVTDNHFFVPCHFTKKAVDGFHAAHSGVNIVDLKSKVIEIGDWTLEMRSVDSSSVFTSYAGIEIALVVNSFKMITGGQKVLLTRYPLNLYRDDEMKTLFQAYHHRCLAGKVPSKDSLPDTSTKGSSVVAVGGGGKFAYGFKAGNTATVAIRSIATGEKGAQFVNSLKSGSSGPAQLKVSGGAKAKKVRATPSKGGIKAASKAIAKGGKNPKHSVARVGTKVPGAGTPGQSASKVATPKIGSKSFNDMKRYLMKKGKK